MRAKPRPLVISARPSVRNTDVLLLSRARRVVMLYAIAIISSLGQCVEPALLYSSKRGCGAWLLLRWTCGRRRSIGPCCWLDRSSASIQLLGCHRGLASNQRGRLHSEASTSVHLPPSSVLSFSRLLVAVSVSLVVSWFLPPKPDVVRLR